MHPKQADYYADQSGNAMASATIDLARLEAWADSRSRLVRAAFGTVRHVFSLTGAPHGLCEAYVLALVEFLRSASCQNDVSLDLLDRGTLYDVFCISAAASRVQVWHVAEMKVHMGAKK